MAYNLYQVQMANAWVERVEKESAMAEKFWTKQAEQVSRDGDGCSVVSTSYSGVSKTTSGTAVLKSRLEFLEKELRDEKEHRRKVEADLQKLKEDWAGTKPSTPAPRSVAGG